MAQHSDLNQVIHIRILNWSQYVGHGKNGRIKSPLFIKFPVDFFHSSRLKMEPTLFRFFAYLVYYASRQDVPGDVLENAWGLSRACSRKARSIPEAVSELVRMQLIQDLTDYESYRREEKKREEAAVNNKGNLTHHVSFGAEVSDKQKLSRPAGAELVSRPTAAQHLGRPAAAINKHWLIDVWNENRGELPACMGVDDKMLEKIECVVEEFPEREEWAAAIAAVATSPWALGKVDSKDWPSRFDLALKPFFWDVAAQALKKKNDAALIEASKASRRAQTAALTENLPDLDQSELDAKFPAWSRKRFQKTTEVQE